jgi:hypothetical protein
MSVTTEDLNCLRVGYAEPVGERRPLPLLVHGLWADAWVWGHWLRYGGELRRFPGLDHLHLIGPEWRGPADAVLDWADRVTGGI